MNNEPLQLGLPPRNGKCAVDFEASQTIQDDALSLREILVRFGAGQPIPSVQNNVDGYPFGDMDDSDFALGDIQDFTDADSFAAHAQNRIDSIVAEAKKVRQNNSANDRSNLNLPADGKNDSGSSSHTTGSPINNVNNFNPQNQNNNE